MRATLIVGALSLIGTTACDPDGLSVSSEDEAVIGSSDGTCQDFNVPVTVDLLFGARIYLQYCTPPAARDNGTLLFMVHTTFHNHFGWDPPDQQFSHVSAALKAGFSVVNIDRLGSGQSTLPPAQMVTIDRVIQAIHGVVVKLRDGSLTGRAYSSIVWLGSSFGAMYSWQHAGRYPADFDGFVLDGIHHRTKLSFARFAVGGQATISVCDDPVFSQTISDCGYLVDAIGFKGPLYYDEPHAAPGMISGPNWEVRLLRDVVSQYLLIESAPYIGILLYPDPTQPGGVGSQEVPVLAATSPSQNLTKPTLVVIGENDPIFCGGPEGFVCDVPTITAYEAPYYSNAPVFDVYVPQDTGHPINLHRSGPASMAFENQWVLDHIVNP
jgi:pimeloyl-ACP methyl ester carboxylesterase